MWKNLPPLILASASPIRRQLLQQAGLQFTVRTAAVDEEKAKQTLHADEVAIHLAQQKALAVDAAAGALVIGADQVLTCEDKLFSKPGTRDAAHNQLTALSGKWHQLESAAAIARGKTIIWSHSSKSRLLMQQLSDHAINQYLDAAGPEILNCVGCYQLEGLGVNLFEKIEGDYFTILGLPLLPLLQRLRQS